MNCLFTFIKYTSIPRSRLASNSEYCNNELYFYIYQIYTNLSFSLFGSLSRPKQWTLHHWFSLFIKQLWCLIFIGIFVLTSVLKNTWWTKQKKLPNKIIWLVHSNQYVIVSERDLVDLRMTKVSNLSFYGLVVRMVDTSMLSICLYEFKSSGREEVSS